MTDSAYPALSEAEQVFYDLIWHPMIIAGESWLDIEVPFLALPVIKQIGDESIQLITDAIFHQIILIIDVEAIKLKNELNQSAYDKASLQLKIVAVESGVGSDAYLKARDAALAALVQFTYLPH